MRGKRKGLAPAPERKVEGRNREKGRKRGTEFRPVRWRRTECLPKRRKGAKVDHAGQHYIGMREKKGGNGKDDTRKGCRKVEPTNSHGRENTMKLVTIANDKKRSNRPSTRWRETAMIPHQAFF